jgi:hypothetical protein
MTATIRTRRLPEACETTGMGTESEYALQSGERYHRPFFHLGHDWNQAFVEQFGGEIMMPVMSGIDLLAVAGSYDDPSADNAAGAATPPDLLALAEQLRDIDGPPFADPRQLVIVERQLVVFQLGQRGQW